MNTNYASLIIDICQSRMYSEEQRFIVQEKLISINEFINDYFKEELIKKVEFSSGDSIQALFYNVSDAFSCYCFIQTLFYPYEIRCGIGYGKINQKIFDRDYASTNMLDGQTYHLALSAITDCKKNNCEFLICSNNKDKDYLINQIMNTIKLLKMDLTHKQAEVFDLFNLLYPLQMKYENEKIELHIDYIIKEMKYNNLSYDFDKTVLSKIRKLLFNDVYSEEDVSSKLLEPSFPTRMNLICSEIFKVSRQNIVKIRYVGKFDEIRKLELLVFDYLKKEYKGENK